MDYVSKIQIGNGEEVDIKDADAIHNGDLQNATPSAAGLMSAADKTKLDGIFDGDQFVIVTDNGTIGSLQAGFRQAYSINLATEYNIPSDGSYIPIGFLTIYPQFTDDKCVIQAFDLYTTSNGQIKAIINICNYGSSDYSNVTMQVKILLWKK